MGENKERRSKAYEHFAGSPPLRTISDAVVASCNAGALRERIRRDRADEFARRQVIWRIAGERPRRKPESAHPTANSFHAEGAQRDLPLYGRRALAGGHVRSQAAS